MKVKLLLCLTLSVFIGYGQYLTPDSREMSDPLTGQALENLKNTYEKKKQLRLNHKGTHGGPISQRMSHADVAFSLYSSLLRTIYSPFAPDSTYIQDFGTPSAIPAHAFGQTFDPASGAFAAINQDYFAQTDPYTVDTIYVGARYFLSSPTSGLTGDTLEVTIMTGDTLDNSVWRVGIGWSANTFPSQNRRIEVIPPRYTGDSTVGVPGSFDAPNKITIKYPLKAIDTANNYIKIIPSAPISVPAGHKIGVFNRFIPGQSYDPNTQIYYRSGAKGDVNNISYLRHTNSSSNDDNSYFLEPLTLDVASGAISSTLFTNTRYRAWSGSDAFRNEYMSPSATRAYLIDFWVSGTSTIGLAETRLNSALKVYPNPSTGRIVISIPQGGNYTLRVVDILGKVVRHEAVQLNGSENISRDFSSLPRGVYMLSLSGDGYQFTSKLTLR